MAIDWEAVIHSVGRIETVHLYYYQMELYGLDHNNYPSYLSPRGQFWVVPWDDLRNKNNGSQPES